MNQASRNQLMTCFFALMILIIASSNKIQLLIEQKPVTLIGTLNGSWMAIFCLFIYSFLWLMEDRIK